MIWSRWGIAVAVTLGILAGYGTPEVGAIPVGKTPDGSVDPPGSNDWSCAPTAGHSEPVILIHGTWDNQNAWDILAPRVKAAGYCVFSLNYGRDTSSVMGAIPGQYATADIRVSARDLAGFVDRVRAATGARKVALVGHSQGAVVARQYVRFEGGADKVGHLISLAGTNHGVSVSGLLAGRTETPQSPEWQAAPITGVAFVQQLTGSTLLRDLNADGDTVAGIAYTAIGSRVDDTSTPVEATFLRAGPGADVDNVIVQDVCPSDSYPHAMLPQSSAVAYIVERALDPTFEGTACG
ncbi:esterase/lipase family protein [Nocardia sp. CDC160]|uniref:esterase/lipase family protein n=1 Tax=Nocardia sp. CDC160 TaxID=3112166 RepID=UPI002DB83210|nr:alpha/beta fold hydrolase [Nocardia sp. CDC160]MEC3920196.1 alpha/beta fold hydrolase [Nocardia sp. CDC160]